jgi:hypothetical protein
MIPMTPQWRERSFGHSACAGIATCETILGLRNEIWRIQLGSGGMRGSLATATVGNGLSVNHRCVGQHQQGRNNSISIFTILSILSPADGRLEIQE